MEHAFYDLDAPVERVCSAEVPMPYAKHLEEAAAADRARGRGRRATGRRHVADADGIFRMPSLGADMDSGTVLEWLVHPGDEVHRGDLVAVVKTDKADIEVEIFEDGVIGELLVPEGTEVDVGTPLATLRRAPVPTPAPRADPRRRAADAVRSAPAPCTRAAAAAAAPTAPSRPPPAPPPAPGAPAGRRAVAASPYARRRAAELGVDLDALVPPQPGHPITAADVERAPPRGTRAGRAARARRARRPGRRDATRDRQSHGALEARDPALLPRAGHLAHAHDGLAHASQRGRSRWRSACCPPRSSTRRSRSRPREMPALNGFWQDDAFVPGDGVHLGVAIALRGGGLIAPAMRDADQLALPELMARLRDLAARARGGRLRGSEMTDATITVTNLGDQGVRAVFGVIYPPQVALVGFGKVADRVWRRRRAHGHPPGGLRHALGRPSCHRRPHRRALPRPTSNGSCTDRRNCEHGRTDCRSAPALAAIAPEADLAGLDPGADLQEELDLDSMDFLNFLIAVGESTGVQIPESDYAQVRTFGDCVSYVLARSGVARE